MKEQTLSQHLQELKNRLIYCLLALLITFGLSYYFSHEIYDFLAKPLVSALAGQQDQKIIYTSLAEAFLTYFKLSFIAAFFFAFPFIALQFYLFLAPALYKNEKKFILKLMFFCPLLFILGAIMLYELVMPLAFKFFISFQNLNPDQSLPIELQTKISEYLGLIIKMIFAFGIAFQLPIFLICLVKFGIVTKDSLKKKRKYWIVIIFTIAAIITPPDIISQVTLALPMILLYEIAILILRKYD